MAYKLHPPTDTQYWDRVRLEAHNRGSDGCTLVADFRVDCCYQHDIEWNGKTIDGEPISRAECNKRFRQCIQSRSKLGRFSLLSWIRWAGVWIGTGWERLTK